MERLDSNHLAHGSGYGLRTHKRGLHVAYQNLPSLEHILLILSDIRAVLTNGKEGCTLSSSPRSKKPSHTAH